MVGGHTVSERNEGRHSGAHSAGGRRHPSQHQEQQTASWDGLLWDPISPDGTNGSNRGGAPGGRRRRRRIVVTTMVLVIVAAIICFGAGLFIQARSLSTQAGGVVSTASTFESQVTRGDVAGAQRSASAIADDVASMSSTINGPLWKLAAHLPVVGRDVQNAQALVGVVQGLSDNVLTPVAANAAVLKPSALAHDGSFDLVALQQAADLVNQVAPALTSANEAVGSLRPGVAGPLNSTISAVQDRLGPIAANVAAAQKALPLLPTLLGSNGQRTYLLVACNEAEIRPNMGFAGSMGVLTADNGKLSVGGFASPGTLQISDSAAGMLVDNEASLDGTDLATRPADFVWTPDFLRGGRLLANSWEMSTGQRIDGIVAMDTTFLQAMFGLVGGVTLDDGTSLDGTNTVTYLNDVYAKYPNDNTQQDKVFAEVAQKGFKSLLGNMGSVSLSELTDTIRTVRDQGRFKVWLATDAEESALSSLGLDGALPKSEESPTIGVYPIDRNWSKVSWYLRASTTAQLIAHNANGSSTYQVTTTFTNTLTSQEAEQGSNYVIGTNPDKLERGDMMILCHLYGPAGGSLGDVTSSTEHFESTGSDTIYGLPWKSLMVHVLPQETVTLTYQVTTSTKAREALAINPVPMLNGMMETRVSN